MNSEIVAEVARATLDGTVAFPEVVRRLVETGVEYYHVDYVARRKTFYGAAGDTVSTPIEFEGRPLVSPELDLPALRAALLDSQRHGQPYREFVRRPIEARVTGYIAFLRGQRVTYWSRGGDQQTEWFPGAGPAPRN